MNRRLFALMLLFLSIILVAGCQLDETIDQTKTAPSQIVIMSLEDDFLIGEGAFFSISIQNSHDIPIEISTPFQLHIIAPSGEDIYLQTNLNDIEPQGRLITIAPQSTTKLPFEIPSHVNLLQLGRYIFWMEIDDKAGNSYRSNDAVFNVIENEYNVSSDDVSLIIASNPTYKLDDSWYFQVQFTNISNKPLPFLKPQDSSFRGWRYPMYLFIVTDQDGNNLVVPGSEASPAPTYSPDSMFTVQPGRTYQFAEIMPRFSGMDRPGTYKIQLMYAVRDQEMFSSAESFLSGETFQPERINWDEDVFLGHIMSNEIAITIEE